MSEHEEEPEITLEEQIKILQEQGLAPEKIVEEILKEDINADINILATTLKMDKMDIGRIKGRLSKIKKREAAKVAPGTGEKATGEGPLYKGELDTTSILKDILTKHPDIPSKVVDEVCSWAEYGPIHPTQLVSLLQSFRGITATTAYIIAQKYALALQKAQLEGKVTPMVVGGQVQQGPQLLGFPTGLPTGSVPGAPILSGGAPSGVQQLGAQQYGIPQATAYGIPYGMPQDVRSIANEVVRIMDERKPKEKETEAYVDIEEPVRLPDGRVVVGEDERPIMRRLHVPASQAAQLVGPTEDAETRFLGKMKLYKEVFGKEELTEDKIRAIIREERPAAPASTEKPITLEDVKKASTEAAESVAETVLEAHEKEDKEERRHKELLSAVKEGASAKAVEGYREDGYRILGQGMKEGADVLRERKPLEVIIKDGGRILFGGTPGKEVEAGAGEGLLTRLKERGWVVEQ